MGIGSIAAKLTRKIPRLGSTVAILKLKGIDGGFAQAVGHAV